MSTSNNGPRHTRQRVVTTLLLAALAALTFGAVTASYSPLLAVAGGVLTLFAVGLDMWRTYAALDDDGQEGTQ